MRDPVAPHTFVLDRIFGRIKTEPQISRPSCSAWEAKTMRTEKIAKFDERTIEREISRLQSMACETTAVFAANEGWLGVGAYD